MFRNGYAHQLCYLNRRRTMGKSSDELLKLKWLYRILQKIHCWVFTYVGAGCNTPLNYDHIFDSIIRRLYALRLIFQVNVSTFILISNQIVHLYLYLSYEECLKSFIPMYMIWFKGFRTS